MRLLLGLIVLIGVVGLWASRPHRVHDWLEAGLSDRLGRPVTLAEPLDIAWGGMVRLRSPKLEIANPDWAGAPHLVDAEGVVVWVPMAAVLQRRFVPDALAVDRLALWLESRPDGPPNWQLSQPDKDSGGGAPATVPLVHVGRGEVRYIGGQDRIDLTARTEAADPNSNAWSLSVTGQVRGRPVDLSGSWSAARKMLDPARTSRIALSGRLGEAQMDGHWDFTHLARAHRAGGQVAAKGDNLRALLESFGVTGPGTRRFNLRSALALRQGEIRLSDLTGAIGDSDIGGAVTVRWQRRDRALPPLVLGHIDAARLTRTDLVAMAQSDPDQEAPPEDGPPQILPDAPGLAQGLRAFEMDLTVRAETLTGLGVPLAQVTLPVSLKRGRLAIRPIRADLAEGALTGLFELDGGAQGSDAPLRLDYDLALNGAAFGQFLQEAGVKGLEAGGRLDARSRLQGAGADLDALLRSARGRMVVAVEDGQLPAMLVEAVGVDVGEALLAGLGAKGGEDQAYAMPCALIAFEIEQGIARANPILIATSDSRIVGSGEIALATERIDLAVRTAPKAKDLEPSGPILIEGRLAKPKVHVSGEAMAAAGLSTLLTPVKAALSFVPGLSDEEQADRPRRCARLADAAAADPQGPS